jgi:alpha-beta hydrolase superfamily lysophospholipase
VSYTVEEFPASDGYTWRYRRYQPVGAPRASVVCIHGIQSHAGWYTYSCSRMAEAGFAVSFLDRRGSGVNEQDRGDTPSYRRILDDIAEYLRWLRQTNPDRPIFLVAISWGGKVGAALQRRHPGLVDGIIFVCPGFFPRFHPSVWLYLNVFFSLRGHPKRPFPIPLSAPEMFTETQRWREFLANDPLTLRFGTARLAYENGIMDGYLRLLTPEIRVPVLLLLAEHDRIIYNRITRRFVERIAQGERTIIEYPKAHHTLEFEAEPDHFINDMCEWLKGHTRSERLASQTNHE